eukprot:7108886-Lingulodinium_polyedra.AAC.1
MSVLQVISSFVDVQYWATLTSFGRQATETPLRERVRRWAINARNRATHSNRWTALATFANWRLIVGFAGL